VVPDNCKTAVTRANYYDPAINKAYHDLAVYYQVAIIPARVRSPRDKSQVEGSVGWIETWLLEWLRDQRFESFAELNGAIKRRSAEIEETAYRSCMGILQLSKKQGNDRLEAACKKARELGSCSYATVSNILKNHLEQACVAAQAKPTAIHENLRGAASFE
jgi:transposase